MAPRAAASLSGALALVLTVGLAAQQPVSPDDFRVPVHEASDGDRGLWTAGPAYKACFADGAFTFYPWLGSAYPRNLPWRWQTESVAVGDRPLPLPPAATHHLDWRVEFRRGAVTERYDVRDDGVEQSFVVHERPAAPGDLVVTGRIETELRPAPVLATAHQALTFLDAGGNALVRYGRAWAIDDAGRRAPVTTSLDGDHVRLVVDGAWLRDATFPVTIDPLTQRLTLETVPSGFGRIGTTDVAHSDGIDALASKLIVYTREFSASDHDAYARAQTGSASGIVFTSLSAVRDVRSAAAAYSASQQRWVLALSFHNGSSGFEELHFYFHALGNSALNSGVSTGLINPNHHYRNVDLGGANDEALLVYEDVTVGSPNVEVIGRWLHVDTRTVGGPAFLLSDHVVGPNTRRTNPTVQQQSALIASGGGVWAVAWQEQSTQFGDDWDLYASVFDESGLQVTGLVADGSEGGSGHALRPRIAGHLAGFGPYHFLLAWQQTPNTGTTTANALRIRRLNWFPPNGRTFDLQPIRTLVTTSQTIDAVQLAHDRSTGSHWAVVYVRSSALSNAATVLRIGNRGGVTETATLFGSATTLPIAPSVCYNGNVGAFEIAYGSSSTATERYALYTQRFEYPADAVSVPYGRFCGSGQISAGRPYAGMRSFQVRLDNTNTPNQPATLLLSLASADIPLDLIGMQTCRLNVDTGAAFIAAIGATTSLFAVAQFELPDLPLFQGDVFCQWLYGDPTGGTTLGISATRGLRAQVR